MKNTAKKLIALVLTLIMVLSIGAVAAFAENTPATTDASQIANPNDPKIEPNADFAPVGEENGKKVWEIHTAADFLEFLNESHRNSGNGSTRSSYSNSIVRLCADIDLNPSWDAKTKTTPQNYLTKPLFYMKCTFDGQGHTIRGLCIIAEGGEKATMITLSSGGTTFQNLKIENAYFSARAAVKNGELTGGSNAGILTAAKYSATFKNIYLDAICEAQNGRAGGFVGAYNATAAADSPSITITDCIFAGEVYATTQAGGFVASNSRPSDNKGKGMYTVKMTDCVNYGKVVSTTPNAAGGFVGILANKGVFTRCYNAGEVETAFFNIAKSTSENVDGAEVTAELIDCYYVSANSKATTTATTDSVTTLTIKYDGAEATTAKTATASELLTLDAFKKTDEFAGWTTADDLVCSVKLKCIITSHSYVDTVVPPVGCGQQGYTQHDCSVCGVSVKDNFTQGDSHTYVETVIAPTCTEKGYTEHKCSVCKDTYTDTEVNAKGHTEGDWIVDREPTTEFSGMKHKECSVCATFLKTEVLPKITAADTETNAPETTENTETTEADAKGGCGSSVALGGVVLMTTVLSLGVTAVSKKRK